MPALAYEEVADFIASGPTPMKVLEFQPSDRSKSRVAELIHKEKTAQASEEEKDELNGFIQVEHIMRLAKVKARQRLTGVVQLVL